MRKSFKIILVSLLFILLYQERGFAQFTSLGTDPSSAKWLELKSEHYTMIYPEEVDSLARKYLFLLEDGRDNILSGLRIDPKPIPVILHPYTTASNGSVIWAPRRMELFTTPPAYSNFAINWEESLVNHELRHVGQMEHYTKQFFGGLSKVIGESSVGLAMGFQASSWMMEADAVIRETILSNSGRGRDATFLMPLRSAFLEKSPRTYDNWRWGSYDYYKPSKYAFGYLVAGYLQLNSENYNAMSDILIRLNHYWYNWNQWVLAFKGASKGNTARRNYRGAKAFATSLWSEDYQQRMPYTIFDQISDHKDRTYYEYTSPIPTDNNGVIALKSGYSTHNKLVLIDEDGKEKSLRPFSTTSSKLYPVDGGFYWSELIPDVRWELKDYSIIRFYDLESKKIKNITSKSRYFNPMPHPSEELLSVIEYPIKGGSNLVIINSKTGEKIFEKGAPMNGQLRESVWVGNDLYAITTTDKGQGIYKLEDINPNSESFNNETSWVVELPEQYQRIESLRVKDDKSFLFASDVDGVHNIYSYDVESHTPTRIVNARFGAFQPILDKNGDLLLSDYKTAGYDVVKVKKEHFDTVVTDFSKPHKYYFAEALTAQAQEHLTPKDSVASDKLFNEIQSLEAKKYSKAGHLFNFHSWAPFYYNVDRIMDMSYEEYYQLISLGAVALSQNRLSTATSFVGYSYHNGQHAGHINFNYSGLFPVFEFSLDINDRKKTITTLLDSNSESLDFEIDTLNKPAIDLQLKSYIPLNFSSGGWDRGFIPEIGYQFSNDIYKYPGTKDRFRQSINYGARFYSVLPKSKSLIYPKWGAGIITEGSKSINLKSNNGDIFFAKFYSYMPGLAPRQGLKFTAQYQYQDNGLPYGYMDNLCSAPRGYNNRFETNNYFKATIDYAIPIHLNETMIKPFFYLMRMKLIPFADFALNSNRFVKNEKMFSFGSDLLFDFHLFRFGFEISCGVRYARTADGKNYWNAVFNTPLY